MLLRSRAARIMARPAAVLGAFVVAASAMVATAPSASAHPLGNFTVNRYARLEVSAGVLRIYYVLDEAEIPTFQEGSGPVLDPGGFARTRANDLLSHLQVTIDGHPAVIAAAAPTLRLLPGQAGLKTLHLTVLFTTSLSGGPTATHNLEFADGNEPERIGWREIVVVSRGDARLLSSNAPDAELSRELTSYPGNLIQSPLDLRHVTVVFTAGAREVPLVPFIAPQKAVARAGAGFAALINRKRVSVLVLLGLLALAAGFGATHALAPGHGKTIMAAYLIGSRGRPRDALLLGTIVSLMHTASVLALGAGLYAVSRNANPDRIYPYLKIASGGAIACWGIWLLVQRLRTLRSQTSSTRGGPLGRRFSGSHRESTSVNGGSAALGGPPWSPSHDHAGHVHLDSHEHDVHVEPAVAATVVEEAARAVQPAAIAGTDARSRLPNSRETGHDGGTEHLAAAERGHHGHDHLPDHRHGPSGHAHDLPEGVAPLSRRGLILLATGGGLFPSPSAVLVLLAAFQLHRTGLGFALIAAFSVGLALTLTSVGLALVYGRRIADRRRGFVSTLRLLPVASAAAISVLGLAFAINGATGLH